jgi:acyl-coenzyme A synthetase/AMP-(fatty) acid ligase/aryl carrier-like protein
LAALVSGADAGKLLPLRQLVVGGEASRTEWLEQVRQKAPGCAVFNHYGPTETTVGVLMHPFHGGSEADSLTVPLGRPIANVRAYVLDSYGQPAPIGAPAELYIGGGLVGRGYLGQPALTAERFVPDPFGAEPGGRLYRTGDRVRQRADGAIEYLGRADGQVKIRGYRVELGEIEAMLARQDGVGQCAVACHDDGRGGQLLTGYVIWREGAAQDFGRLQDALKSILPEHMTPKAWVRLDQLPLSAHGKVNRQALPAPSAGSWERAARYIAPESAAEQLLAAIWSEVLGRERVGAHDNFFELGGHSLAAIRVMSRIRRILGVDVPLHALFQSPTIAGLWSAILECETVSGSAQKLAEDMLEAAAAQ